MEKSTEKSNKTSLRAQIWSQDVFQAIILKQFQKKSIVHFWSSRWAKLSTLHQVDLSYYRNVDGLKDRKLSVKSVAFSAFYCVDVACNTDAATHLRALHLWFLERDFRLCAVTPTHRKQVKPKPQVILLDPKDGYYVCPHKTEDGKTYFFDRRLAWVRVPVRFMRGTDLLFDMFWL